VCWQCLFNYKQTSFVLSQTLGFPTGFCGEQQLWVSPAAAGWSCGRGVWLGLVLVVVSSRLLADTGTYSMHKLHAGQPPENGHRRSCTRQLLL
jgi:hypothetical protein